MTDDLKARYERFDLLATRHKGLIRSMCWHHAYGSDEVCRDLVQECYERLWLRLDRLDASAPEWMRLGWLVWQCRSVCSHRARKMRMWTSVAGRHEARQPGDNDDRREDLEELMTALGEAEREVVRLLMAGYTTDEIAAMKGRTVEAIRKTRQRAIQRMKDYQQKTDAI